MRRRLAILALMALALTVLGAVLVGCGSKFELPTEQRIGRVVPSNGEYTYLASWNTAQIQDLLLTQGSGTQLFLLFNDGLGGAGTHGRVEDYFLTRQQPVGHSMQGGLFNPIALANGGDGGGGTANRIYVLDQGDTLNAKSTLFACDTCIGARWITNLGRYWRVREYGLLGGDTVSTFTDTSLAFVNGIAADDEGSVYVSGIAVVLSAASSPFLFNKDFISKIYKYRRGPRYPGAVPNDRNMPGANWHRDTTYSHTLGSGVGFINDPRGMAWGRTFPAGLFVADLGNNSGQKLSDTDSTGFFRYDQDGGTSPITAPVDIAVDASGFVYLCDTGNHRVLRYDPSGAFIQQVDTQNPAPVGTSTPIAVAANDSLVYVADRARGEVVRYQRH